MKALPTLLLGSLAANAALLAAFAFKPALAPPALRDLFQPSTTSEARSAAAGGIAASTRSALAREGEALAAEAARRASIWSTLDTDDLPTLVSRLRAAGFSRTVVRTIVSAKIEERFAGRMKELTAPIENAPYWKPDAMTGAFGMPAYYEQYNQIYRERSRLLRELLGNEATSYAADPAAAQRRQFGDIPQQKIELIQRINDDYAEMMTQVRAAMGNITLPEDREKLALLEREKRADLAAMLTPEELAAYEMRSSPVTSRLRMAMTILDSSEAEFQTLFKIHQAFNDRINLTNVTAATPDFMNQRTEAQKQQTEQLKAALGETRYAEFMRANNSEYQQLYRIAQREGITTDAANRAYAVRDHVAAESKRIFDDPSLGPEAKRTALKNLGQSTRAQLVSTLGQNAGTSYAQNLRWLTHLDSGGGISITPEGTTSMRPAPSLPTARTPAP